MTLSSDLSVPSSLSSSTIDMISGTAAGTAQVIVGHPFDTIKVRLQTQGKAGLYSNAIDCFKKTTKHEGFFALYKGVTSPILGIGICNAVLFTSNGYFQSMLATKNNGILSLQNAVLAGALAGGVMAFVNCPIELLKIRMQVQSSHSVKMYANIFDCGFKVMKADGFFGLYRGIIATILRDMPSFASYFGVYEGCKSAFRYTNQDHAEPAGWQLLISGGLAGLGAWHPLCFGFDVIKSRIQANKIAIPYLTTTTITEMWQEAGLRAFFRGYGPTLLRAFPANAATFLAYEITKQYLVTQPISHN